MTFKNNDYTEITDFISKNAQNPIKIVVISKNHPLNSIQEALNFGVRTFGENKVQEAKAKFLDLKTKFSCRKNNQLHFPMDKGLTVPK